MNRVYILCLACLITSLSACAQQADEKSNPSSPKTPNNMPVNTEQLNNVTVKAAIEALQKGDEKTWLSLFTQDCVLYDDGNKIDFHNFSKNAIGHERFQSIDKIENNGLDLYGKFHSDQWGDFKTYFKFHINSEGKINRLDIGQAN
jgi:hypothetical protein